ncbi:MAG: UTP--glucose-1-phosphate uridylyltransferase [Acidobacteria bacterium]|nr:UTP--glucose-1-phosphate uridylyltransferase [Acidobacteriota bacterium]
MKGVIMAAGYGTRFLPVTKTVPKEMLPLVEIPSIQFIVDEFVATGIRDILIITSRRKKVLEDYFDKEMELEGVFREESASAKLAKIVPVPVNVFFVRQQEMKGTAHALMLCEPFTASAPFVVAYPDDIMLSETPCSLDLIRTWERTVTDDHPHGCSVLSVIDLHGEDVSRYGVVDPERRGDLTYVRRMVEKPPPGTEPSPLVSLGRYLYTPEIYPVLRRQANQPRDGEYYQTEPINELAGRGKVVCTAFTGIRYDTGEPLGYLKTVVSYALQRDDLRADFVEFLKTIIADHTRTE